MELEEHETIMQVVYAHGDDHLFQNFHRCSWFASVQTSNASVLSKKSKQSPVIE